MSPGGRAPGAVASWIISSTSLTRRGHSWPLSVQGKEGPLRDLVVAEATEAMEMAIEAVQGRAAVRVVVPLEDLVRKLGAGEPWLGVSHRPRPGGRAT